MFKLGDTNIDVASTGHCLSLLVVRQVKYSIPFLISHLVVRLVRFDVWEERRLLDVFLADVTKAGPFVEAESGPHRLDTQTAACVCDTETTFAEEPFDVDSSRYRTYHCMSPDLRAPRSVPYQNNTVDIPGIVR